MTEGKCMKMHEYSRKTLVQFMGTFCEQKNWYIEMFYIILIKFAWKVEANIIVEDIGIVP